MVLARADAPASRRWSGVFGRRLTIAVVVAGLVVGGVAVLDVTVGPVQGTGR